MKVCRPKIAINRRASTICRCSTQDLERNLLAEVVRFKNELARADGILIVTPEHDRSVPALLKNAVDWGARPCGKNSWIGKPAFITGTSPGAIGTALAQQHLRAVMTGIGIIVLGGKASRTREHHRREHAEISPRASSVVSLRL